jgi:hypothetical protein
MLDRVGLFDPFIEVVYVLVVIRWTVLDCSTLLIEVVVYVLVVLRNGGGDKMPIGPKPVIKSCKLNFLSCCVPIIK